MWFLYLLYCVLPADSKALVGNQKPILVNAAGQLHDRDSPSHQGSRIGES